MYPRTQLRCDDQKFPPFSDAFGGSGEVRKRPHFGGVQIVGVGFFQVAFDLDMWEGDRSRLRHAARAVFWLLLFFFSLILWVGALELKAIGKHNHHHSSTEKVKIIT